MHRGPVAMAHRNGRRIPCGAPTSCSVADVVRVAGATGGAGPRFRVVWVHRGFYEESRLTRFVGVISYMARRIEGCCGVLFDK